MISAKLRSPSVSLNLQCPAGRINTVKKAKYLGIILDNQLNFADHIKNIETKVARSVGILSKLSYYLPNSATVCSNSTILSYIQICCMVGFG